MKNSFADDPNSSEDSKRYFTQGESLEFAGMAVVRLALDPLVIKKTGKVLLTADLARECGFVDDNGLINSDMREVQANLDYFGWPTLAKFVPRFIRIPHIFFYLMGYKF